MKFAEHLSAHITPEWRKQYISYELSKAASFAEQLAAGHAIPEWRSMYIEYQSMKEMLYAALESMPNPAVEHSVNSQAPLEAAAASDAEHYIIEYVEEFDQNFLHFAEKELAKINTFFAEKLAEATRKFADLKSELNAILPGGPTSSTLVESDYRMSQMTRSGGGGSGGVVVGGGRGGGDGGLQALQGSPGARSKESGSGGGKEAAATTRKAAKKISDLKLAFSEFYLSLVLLQNYQELNFTGFRKILKKHDKVMGSSAGVQWRQANVDGARFYTCKDVLRLIEESENLFTNVLENGDRSRAMKRLRVPPLNAQQSLWTTYRVGAFSGAFVVLLLALLLTVITRSTSTSSSSSSSTSSSSSSSSSTSVNWAVACRLFRGPFFVALFTFFIGLNVYGWRTSGVNHVLIFELNPRDHISEQHLFEISFAFAVIWALSLLGYLFAGELQLNPNIFPLLNVVAYLLFLFNPTRTFKHSARFWLIRVLMRVFAAPFCRVTFADFWLADQLNSLSILFSDFVYYICFYVNFYSADENGESGSGNLCMFDSKTYLIVRALLTALPAWFRFAQCLRRYADEAKPTRSLFPHVVNAGKYSTTFFVVAFSTMTELTIEVKNDKQSSPVFSLWIASLLISSIYTYAWDIKMDWGLMEATSARSRNGEENFLLREEIVYPSPAYYYLAYLEDFIGRTLWAFTVSLNHVGSLNTDLLTTLAASFELFRRFIWNFFRLENEHLNNCGEFRAVRDISIAPMAHSPPGKEKDGSSGSGGNGGKHGGGKPKKKAKFRRSIQYSINSNSAKAYQEHGSGSGSSGGGGKASEVTLLMDTRSINTKNYDKL